MNRLFLLDPAPSQSAWMEYVPACVAPPFTPPGLPVEFGILPNKEIEARIAHHLVSPEWTIICEDVNAAGTAGQETFDTCRTIARFEMLAEMSGVRFERFPRTLVKQFLLGNPSGKDPLIRGALIKAYKLPSDAKKKDMGMLAGVAKDTWAALAVGVAWDMREVLKKITR